jgi:hypothetical protein
VIQQTQECGSRDDNNNNNKTLDEKNEKSLKKSRKRRGAVFLKRSRAMTGVNHFLRALSFLASSRRERGEETGRDVYLLIFYTLSFALSIFLIFLL